MGFQLSPGVNVTEIDLTTIIPAVGTTVGAIAGPFTWGPANKPMLVDSELTLVNMFGKPDNDSANTWFTAANFLSYANALQTVRIVKTGTSGHKNATADGTGLLITNEDSYLNTYAGGGDVGMFAAKYAGNLGNSIGVGIADADSFGSWEYKANFPSAPNTSLVVANGGGLNDEVHVVVVDTLGYWTGTAGEVLERFAFLSKCATAKNEDGTTMYYPEVLNRRSKYVWWMGHPTGEDLGLVDPTSNWGGAETVTYDTTSTKLTLDNVTGTFTVGDTVADATGATVSTGSGAVLGTPVIGDGGILTIPKSGAGSGYLVAPNVLIDGDGGDATAVAVLSGNTVDTITVTAPGQGYTINGTSVTISSGDGASATAVLAASGSVKDVTLGGSGTNYEDGDALIFTSSSGINAAATITVVGGDITAIVWTNHGSGYVSTDVPVVTVDGPGTGKTLTAVLGFAVASFTDIVGGTEDYTSVPTVGISGDGSGASATAVLVNGALDHFTALVGGSNYTTAPSVSITAVGSGATCDSITLNTGKILSIEVVSGGSGYVDVPAVSFSAGNAVATAVLVSEVVDHIVMVSSSDYVSAPTATIVPAGSGAEASVTVSAAGRILSLNATAVGSGYTQGKVTVVISGPGTGADITANVTGGQILTYTVNSWGSGYSTVSARVVAVASSLLTVAPIYGTFEVGDSLTDITLGATGSANVTGVVGGVLFKSLSGGVDANALLAEGEYFTGLDLFRSGIDIDISLLLTADANTTVQEYAINDIAEYRKDCVVFLSPPRVSVVGNDGNEAADIVVYRDQLPSSSYAVMDSGWKYQYDKYADIYRYVPLNGDVAGLCVRTDVERDPWWSPAGYNRGNVKNVVKLAWNPRKPYRDVLYQAGVNPVMTDPGLGTILFGDKTLLAKPSAFDRINVRRLFIVIEKAIATASKFTLFEFNDQFTRAQFVNMVDPYLRDVKGRRGIYDYRVVCDSSNNTPEVIDSNRFVGDIYVKPARSINFIQLNFVAVRTGVEFSEIVGKF